MTNGDRADRLLADAILVATEMRNALGAEGWNLAARRAQEVTELAIKALLNQLGVDYPKTHDPAPLLAEALRARGIETEAAFLDWLVGFSLHLTAIRSPAFYQEIAVSEAESRDAVVGAERVLGFSRKLLQRLRGRSR